MEKNRTHENRKGVESFLPSVGARPRKRQRLPRSGSASRR